MLFNIDEPFTKFVTITGILRLRNRNNAKAICRPKFQKTHKRDIARSNVLDNLRSKLININGNSGFFSEKLTKID